MMDHGGDVWQCSGPGQWLDFSASLRPEGPPDWVLEAMARALEAARYYPQRSMDEARRGLCAYAGVEPARLLPTAGGVAAIDLICQVARRVFYLPPTFNEYARRARVHGRHALPYQGELGTGDVLFLCNPNNPTGEALSRQAVLELGERVARQGGILAVDEAFIDYCPECSVRDRAGDSLWVAGSLTKILAIPGARLGYLLSGQAPLAAMEALALPWALNAFAGAVAQALPDHLDQLAQEAALNRLRREQLAQALASRGALVFPSQANFLLADLGRTVPDLREQGILVRDCASFGLSPRHLRVGVRTPAENLRLIQALWPSEPA